MTADAMIAAVHAVDDELRPLVEGLADDQLTGPSAASQWTVAQVLSHLGSGAVIAKAALDAALAGQPNPGFEANKVVWARWDAMGPQEQRSEFLVTSADLLTAYDAVPGATREALKVDLGFLPQPVDLATAVGFRLNEYVLHSWDVRVALDPASTLTPGVPALVLDLSAMMLGWLAKPAAVLAGRTLEVAVTLTDLDRQFGLHLAEDGAGIGATPADATGTLAAPAEAWLRLLAGRLAPQWTPSSVSTTGEPTLDDLRAIFPGF